MPCLSSLRREPPRSRRFALLIGIRYLRYEDVRVHLDCTHEDVDLMKKLLVNVYGYPEENIRVLADREGDVDPTRKNILDAIAWLVQRAVQDAEHDYKLLFYFSGHGAQQIDPKNRERDGQNEAVVPVDALLNARVEEAFDGTGRPRFLFHGDEEQSGFIIDDDLNRLLARPLPAHTRLLALIDCCHSGTALDLQFPYIFDELQFSPGKLARARLLSRPHWLANGNANSRKTQTSQKPSSTPLVLRPRLSRALGLEPDTTVTRGLSLVTVIPRWTLQRANLVLRKAVNHAPPRISAGPGRQAECSGLQLMDNPSDSEYGVTRPVKSPVYRAIAALHSHMMSCLLETDAVATVALLPAPKYRPDDWEYVDADVVALGACSDHQKSPDSASLARFLTHIHQEYRHPLTFFQMLGAFSEHVKPNIPSLSSSREMTAERWDEPFTL